MAISSSKSWAISDDEEASVLKIVKKILSQQQVFQLDDYFVKNPLDLTKVYGEKISISGVAWEPLMRAGLFIDHYFNILGVIFLTVIIFSIYPAFKASHTDPIEAIERNL